MRWPKYWSFSFSIIPSKEVPGLISFSPQVGLPMHLTPGASPAPTQAQGHTALSFPVSTPGLQGPHSAGRKLGK